MEVAGIVSSFLSCFCAQNCTRDSIGRQCMHIINRKRQLELLQEKMEDLAAMAGDVNSKLKDAQVQHGMDPKATVKLWLDHVSKTGKEVSDILSLAKRRRPRLRHLPERLCRPIKLAKRIEEKISEVVALSERVVKFEHDLFDENLVKRGRILPAILPMMNPSTMENLLEIWGYLIDSQVGRIGVYGMGGVGKTTIMTEINNKLLNESPHFDCILWVNVSKESNLERLQMDIAEQLKLDLSHSVTEIDKCARLFDALSRRKRFVLILDDLWEPFSLEKIGIPIPSRENGCKLVLTTRLVSVCRAMETEKDVGIKVLTETEAWDLFQEKVGKVAVSNPGIQHIAAAVATECGGLPLAIVTVGRALRGAIDTAEWENALTELRGSTANIERMEEEVFTHLRFSFIKLKDDTSRACFLFCSLFPKGHQIDVNELIEYWMWEGLLGDVGTIQALKQKGKMVLRELKFACLLQIVTMDGTEYMTMHDLVRDMLIAITCTSPRCLIKPGYGLKITPWLDEWFEDLQRVSLMTNNLKGISFKPSCPKLTALLLQNNPFTESIIDTFFDDMISLEVLDLSSSGIHHLPESLSGLENLRALLLRNCWNLFSVPSLAKLVKLKILDISWSRRIIKLAPGIEQLHNLRRLDLTHSTIEFFPKGLLAAFLLLEELLMVGCGFLWGSEQVGTIIGGATIEEVINCTTLSSLEVDFWNFKVFQFYIGSGHWDQLEGFKFTIGQPFVLVSEKRSIAFRGNFCTRGKPIWLPPITSGLYLDDDRDILSLSVAIPNLTGLKYCEVRNARVFSIVVPGLNKLSTLEKLKLVDLHNLWLISSKFVEGDALSNLRTVEVVRCNNLKFLFLRCLLENLHNLEEIVVRDCGSMKRLVQEEEEEQRGTEEGCSVSTRISFPKLRSLKLYRLPYLESLYDGFMVCDVLHSIEISDCRALHRLPFTVSEDNNHGPPPALKEIIGTIDWWESLEWDLPEVKNLFQPYFREWQGMLPEDGRRADKLYQGMLPEDGRRADKLYQGMHADDNMEFGGASNWESYSVPSPDSCYTPR